MNKAFEIIGEKFRTNIKRRIGNDNMPVLLRRGTRVELAQCFCDLGYTEGVEIGTQYGRFAKVLCESNPGLHLYCVDPWMAYQGYTIKQERQEKIYEKAMRTLKPLNVSVVKKASMDAVSDFPDASLDFVYIDGNHTFDYVMLDILFWQHKVKKGGVMALHDYRPGWWAGVVQAVDAYTHCHDIRPWFVTREEEPTAFWVKK